MTAIDKGQQEQQGSGKKSYFAPPRLDESVEAKSLRKSTGDMIPVSQENSGEEAELNEQESSESGFAYWLKIVAAVGIPLALLYLAVAGLVNPQFAELRELVSSNRDAISENRDAISSNREAIASVENRIERLEDRINLIAEVLILATTNDNITEAELRNLLNAGEE